jgi:hypothetical protein
MIVAMGENASEEQIDQVIEPSNAELVSTTDPDAILITKGISARRS